MNSYIRSFFVASLLMLAGVLNAHAFGANPQKQLSRSYPFNGTTYANPATAIGLTYADALDSSSIADAHVEVIGSIHGAYDGSLRLALDSRTVIFTPTHPFALGERVNVTCTGLRLRDGELTNVEKISFTVRKYSAQLPKAVTSDDPLRSSAFTTASQLNKANNSPVEGLPVLTVTRNENPSDGNLYLSPMNFGDPSPAATTYLMILDKSANVLFSRQPGPGPIIDFLPHPNNTYSFFYGVGARFYILDSTLTRFDSVTAVNGTQADSHELLYLSDGRRALIGLDILHLDLRPYGGDSNSVVIENVIQEFDKAKNLIFEWRGLDHFKITDVQDEPGVGPMPVDYCHMNALGIDNDENILISSRHMDEITKIDHNTGDIIWRFGGKNNQFTLIGDSIQFSHQHSIRVTKEGTYLIFDNGNFHKKGGVFSRGVEYRLDTANKTATLVWEFRHDPPLFADAMGSVQRLDNGNTIIGWGRHRGVAATELDNSNNIVFEMLLDSSHMSYRVLKFPDSYLHSEQALTPIHSTALMSQPIISCVPNPATDRMQIQFTNEYSGPVRVLVFDMLGRTVATLFDGSVSAGAYTTVLDAHSLSAGAYRVRIESPRMAPMTQEIVITK